MEELLFIVARDQSSLYNHLTREFSAEENVHVILDRRQSQRRRQQSAEAAERRCAERRSQAQVDAQLRSLGYAILRVS
ncbi:MAG: hypothetical protein HY727_10615 [Candidatus Rokubacteria bacterium]|nr:hypothetical protein [Candidatus Rokubacteria bacterium]